MAAGRNEKKKEKDITLALKREVTAIYRHFFIRDILQPLKVYKGSEIFRAMAALSTDVRKNDKSLKFPRFEYLLEYIFFLNIFEKIFKSSAYLNFVQITFYRKLYVVV